MQKIRSKLLRFFTKNARLLAYVGFFLYLCTLFELYTMYFYYLIIQIAALCGHRKARLLVAGQRQIAFSNEGVAVNGEVLPKQAIWIHVSSVGEFEQARPLIEHLRSEKPNEKIVLTFFSPSGYELRKKYDKVDRVIYLPFPTRRNARRFIEGLQPKMALFVKYEFWPAYLRALHKADIPTYSISAIFRPQQTFFRPWGKWYLKLLTYFTHIYVQDEASRRLLAEHGVHQCSVVGDTRFDRVRDVMAAMDNNDPVRIARLRPIREFVEGCERVLIAGSTWPQDEELLAEYMEQKEEMMDRGVKLILVPHEIHESHMHFIFNRLKGRMVKYSTISELKDDVSRQNILRRAQVMVIDTIGLLSSIYRFGQVAYIGGGFGVGIHNTIEAAVYGVPVIFGPNYSHFREAKGLIEAGAARSISNYAELEAAVDNAFAHHEDIGAKAAMYVQSELGATEKIYGEIF